MFFKFELTYNGVLTLLSDEEQPEGISSLESVLRRDFDASGAFFSLTGEDLNLKFPGTGREVFKTARNTEGVDAVVSFQMFKRSDQYQAWTSVYVGTGIMDDSMVIDLDFAHVGFEEINLLSLINKRQEIPAPLNAVEDMDGNTIAAATEESIAVQGRPILQESIGRILGGGGAVIDSVGQEFSSITCIFLEKSNEIEWPSYAGFVGSDPSGAPGSTAIFGGELRAELQFGAFTVTVSVVGGISFQNEGATVTGSLSLYLRQVGASGTTNHLVDSWNIDDFDTAAGPVGPNTIGVSIDYQLDVEITEDEVFTLLFQEGTSFNGSGTARVFTNFTVNNEGLLELGGVNLEFSMSVNRTAPETTVSGYFIHEALRHNLEQISGITNALDAPFFGRAADGYASDGAAAFFTQFNGYRARGFSTRPVVNVFKDSLESLIAIFNVGYGIEENYDGNFVLKIAPREYFYADEVLAVFTDVIEYEESFYDWFMVNKIEIGFEKFSGDDEFPGTLNDFNTSATYLTPFVAVEGEHLFKSKYIGSDILLEITRRKQFDATPSESWKYDDDIFIMDVQDPYDTGFEQGSVYEVDNIGINYAGLAPINLTINPRFNAYNFFSILNSFLYKKPLTAPFRNQEYKVNGGEQIFYTGGAPELGDTEIFPGGVGAPPVDQNLVALEAGTRLFDPIKISFKVAMSSAQVDNIVKAHRNSADSANYGYISVTNNEGETKTGWLLELRYNIIDEIGTFELITRSENYQI